MVAPSHPVRSFVAQVSPSAFQLLPSGPPPFHERIPTAPAPMSERSSGPHALVTPGGASVSIFTQSNVVKAASLPDALDGTAEGGERVAAAALRGHSGPFPQPAIDETSKAQVAISSKSVGCFDIPNSGATVSHLRRTCSPGAKASSRYSERIFDDFELSGVSFKSFPSRSSVNT
jgi:hypothetical protein